MNREVLISIINRGRIRLNDIEIVIINKNLND